MPKKAVLGLNRNYKNLTFLRKQIKDFEFVRLKMIIVWQKIINKK